MSGWDEMSRAEQKALVAHIQQLSGEAARSLADELTRMSVAFGAPFEFHVELTMTQRGPRPADIILAAQRKQH